ERLRDLTGGKSYPDQADALAKAVTNGDVFRPTGVRSRTPQPIWSWLVLLTGVGLFFDVAVRRLSIDPLKLSRGAQEVWAHLLGTARTERQGDFLEKLQSRKVQIGEALDKGKAERRFEGAETSAAPAATGEVAMPAPKPPPKPAAPRGGPEGEKEPADYASRLLRAKKRAMEERDKDKGKP
ncbi:MAG TPA: hypothetical protein VEL76_07785, partial [Gemmataceae bacterium]|nr:hypothetical protein [Gemmataceae bacterium]